ncbi:DmpA family aminopeptidase [Nocardia neocaledoniensis]
MNSITDVPGVRVGQCTLVDGDGPLRPGVGPVRTGVTIIEPRPRVWESPVYAGMHTLNGNGEITGTDWIRDNGQLTTPIGLTNTHSVGVVRDALVAEIHRQRGDDEFYFCLPVVGETYDGLLSDINGQHVRAEHVERALAALDDGPVAEGTVGGGTGMICHEFKGGIGTASRTVATPEQTYTLGVLLQSNHGRRTRLRIDGIPVGERIGTDVVSSPQEDAARVVAGSGSIIVIVATDAPLLPHQCTRIAQRAALGIGRTGGAGETLSGDMVLAFSTGNTTLPSVTLHPRPAGELAVRTANDELVDLLFDAAIDATEEAIVNSMVAATTVVGRDGITAHALDHDLLRSALAG